MRYCTVPTLDMYDLFVLGGPFVLLFQRGGDTCEVYKYCDNLWIDTIGVVVFGLRGKGEGGGVGEYSIVLYSTVLV